MLAPFVTEALRLLQKNSSRHRRRTPEKPKVFEQEEACSALEESLINRQMKAMVRNSVDICLSFEHHKITEF